jgi:two-component system response regulator QseB
MPILLAEDDAMVGRAIRKGLLHAGFAVDWVTDGRAAEVAIDDASYSPAILDLSLPHKDGMALIKSLGAAGNPLPILIASARDSVRDRIAGLEAGADDYILKPFDLDELVCSA